MPIICRLSLGSGIGITNRCETGLMTGGRGIKQLKFGRYSVPHAGGNHVFSSIFTSKAFPHWIRIAFRVVGDGLCGGIVQGVDSGKVAILDHGVRRKAIETVRVAMVNNLVIVEVEEHLVLQNG